MARSSVHAHLHLSSLKYHRLLTHSLRKFTPLTMQKQCELQLLDHHTSHNLDLTSLRRNNALPAPKSLAQSANKLDGATLTTSSVSAHTCLSMIVDTSSGLTRLPVYLTPTQRMMPQRLPTWRTARACIMTMIPPPPTEFKFVSLHTWIHFVATTLFASPSIVAPLGT